MVGICPGGIWHGGLLSGGICPGVFVLEPNKGWHHKREKFLPLWRKMLVEKQYKYPHFLHIIRILLACPVSTAQVGRQFSFIKRILGD